MKSGRTKVKYCNYIKGAEQNFRNLSCEMLIQFHIFAWIQTSLPLSGIDSFIAAFAPGIGLAMYNFYNFQSWCSSTNNLSTYPLSACLLYLRSQLRPLKKRKVLDFLAPILCQSSNIQYSIILAPIICQCSVLKLAALGA